MHASRWGSWILLPILALSLPVRVAADPSPLDTAARHFRMQVYESFRTNRPLLDHRLATADALLRDWRERGAPSGEIPDLVTWFRQATEVARNRDASPIPQYIPIRSSDSPAEEPPTQIDGVPSAGVVPSQDGPSAASRPSAPDITQSIPRQPSPAAPPQARSSGNQRTPPPARPHNRRKPPDELPPLDVNEFAPEKPLPRHLATGDRLPSIRLQTSSARQTSASHSLVAPAPPTRVDEYMEPTPHAAAAQPTEVDLGVLSAKIRSFNLSLQAVESELLPDHEWTVAALEGQLHDLTQLIDAAGLLQIYYEAIAYEQRELLEPMMDTGPVRALFAQRAFETRIRLTDEARDDGSGIVADRLDRLERISEVMQRWKTDQQN